MTTGYVATARILPLDGEFLDVKNLNFNATYRLEKVYIENNGLTVKTIDKPTEEEARQIIDYLSYRIPCQVEDVVVTSVFPGPNLSYTYLFASHIETKFVQAYVDRVRASGLNAKIFIKAGEPLTFFHARIGLFPDYESCATRCHKIFLTTFRYAVHGEDDPLPPWEGGAKRLCEFNRFLLDDSCEVIEIKGAEAETGPDARSSPTSKEQVSHVA